MINAILLAVLSAVNVLLYLDGDVPICLWASGFCAASAIAVFLT